MFAELLSHARTNGFRGDLRVPATFFSTELIAGYTIADWIFDRVSPQEHRTYLKSQGTKSPYLIDLPELQAAFGMIDFRFQGQEAEGLGVAHLVDGLAVSLDSHDRWHTSTLILDVLQFGEDEAFVSTTADVLHACRLQDLVPHAARLASLRLDSVKNGAELWNRREELFSRLIFVAETEKQLAALGFQLPHVKRKLTELEQHARSWQEGGFDPTGLSGNPRTESKATLEKYGDQRSFLCPDGVKRTFSWHLNLPGGWRLYFFPLDIDRQIIVGYIGTHPTTVKFA